MRITPRITLLILGLCLAPMGLLSAHYYWSGKAALRREVLDHLGSTALHLEERVEEGYRQRHGKFSLILAGRAMARSFAGYLVPGGLDHADRLVEYFERLHASVPDMAGYALLDTAGRVVMVPDPTDVPPAAVLDSLARKDWRLGPVDVWVPDSSGLTLYLGGPVKADGRVIGMLVCRTQGLNLRELARQQSSSRWDICMYLMTLSAERELISVRTDKPTRYEPLDSRDALHAAEIADRLFRTRRDTVFTDLVKLSGSPVLAVVRFLNAAEWSLVVQVDKDVAFAPLRRFRNRTLLALGAVSLAAILASFLASRRLTRPLLDLIALAREFSAGNLGRRAPADSADELGELSRSLNAMAENLVSRRELQAYIDRMSTLSAKLGLDGKVLMANRAFLAATGRPADQVLGRDFLDGGWLLEGAVAEARMIRAFQEARLGKVAHREEALHAEGRTRMVHLTLNPVRDEAGAVEYVILEGRDITALKDAQAALYEVNEGLEESVRERTRSLQGALREKEILLREVHHRVKNNLQIISSLLSLQSVHVRDPQVAGVLVESRNRVKSMALVHERLYAGDDLGKVGFNDYIRDLAAQLVRSSDGATQGVGLHFELDDLSVGLTQGIPCGLVIHELVANSLKHAFPGGRSARGTLPKVVIRCRAHPEGGFELEVEDNGVGLPEGFDPRKSRSLGLQLVFTLVRQLRGELRTDRGAGTRFRITIPALDEKESEHAI